MSEISAKAYRISALNALYIKHEIDKLPGSIDSLYQEAVSKAAFLRDDIVSQFDRMMVIMIYYEMLNLINHKVSRQGDDGSHRTISESLLDKMISAWLEVFPDNKVKRARGEVLFARKDDGENMYSSFKLSDGDVYKRQSYWSSFMIHSATPQPPRGCLISQCVALRW